MSVYTGKTGYIKELYVTLPDTCVKSNQMTRSKYVKTDFLMNNMLQTVIFTDSSDTYYWRRSHRQQAESNDHT